MGNLRGSWFIWLIGLILAGGCLFGGISATHYFQANAASVPINQPKNPSVTSPKSISINQPRSISVNHQQVAMEDEKLQVSKYWKLEKEMEQKQQEQTSIVHENQQQQASVKGEKLELEKVPHPSAVKEDQEKHAATPPAPTVPAKETQPNLDAGKTQSTSSNKKIIYLTFDDGPAAFSGDIIDLLEKHHDKATFFMIDGNIRRYPDSVKQMVQHHESVGLHSVSHDVKKFYASVNSVLGELTQNRNTLKEISGVDSHLARTPYGSHPYMTPEYRKAVKDNGYILWDWNIDSKDWYYKDDRYITNVIQQLNQLAHHHGPIVILLHERKETLAHLPKLLDYLSAHGYESRAIDSSVPAVQFN